MKALVKRIAKLIKSILIRHNNQGGNPVPTIVPTIYLGDKTALTQTIYGHKLYVDTEDLSLTPHLLLDGYWESWISQVFLKMVKPDMCVVEVGSNVGYYSLLAASQIGTNGFLYSFEANPRMYDLLKRNLDVNGFIPISKCINKAVINRGGKTKFKVLKKHLGGSYICRSLEQQAIGENEEVIEVESTSLDVELGNNAQVDILKIDAEGAEPLILKGASNILKNNHDIRVILEFHIDHFEDDNQAYQYLKYLRDLGFKINLITFESLVKPVKDKELIEQPINHELLLFR